MAAGFLRTVQSTSPTWHSVGGVDTKEAHAHRYRSICTWLFIKFMLIDRDRRSTRVLHVEVCRLKGCRPPLIHRRAIKFSETWCDVVPSRVNLSDCDHTSGPLAAMDLPSNLVSVKYPPFSHPRKLGFVLLEGP